MTALLFTQRCISIGSKSCTELVWLRLLFCLLVWAGGQAGLRGEALGYLDGRGAGEEDDLIVQ